jgi:hypothetical protein
MNYKNFERKEMAKIFVVTDGNYSDYHIIGVWTDGDVAKKYADVLGATVEEYEDGEKRSDLFFWSIYANHDGKMTLCAVDDVNQPYQNIGVKYNSNGVWKIYLNAVSREQAIKSANEMRTQYIALHPQLFIQEQSK